MKKARPLIVLVLFISVLSLDSLAMWIPLPQILTVIDDIT